MRRRWSSGVSPRPAWLRWRLRPRPWATTLGSTRVLLLVQVCAPTCTSTSSRDGAATRTSCPSSDRRRLCPCCSRTYDSDSCTHGRLGDGGEPTRITAGPDIRRRLRVLHHVRPVPAALGGPGRLHLCGAMAATGPG